MTNIRDQETSTSYSHGMYLYCVYIRLRQLNNIATMSIFFLLTVEVSSYSNMKWKTVEISDHHGFSSMGLEKPMKLQ